MPESADNQITVFAKTNFRNQERVFGIKADDRRRHMYLIGKTGLLTNTPPKWWTEEISTAFRLDGLTNAAPSTATAPTTARRQERRRKRKARLA